MKRTSMSIEKIESLIFYKYLCEKIGSEEVVRIRRLAFTISDIGKIENRITSGSKGEGLDFKDSDLDIMFIDRHYKVYESGTELKDVFFTTIPLIMNTEETQPCYTQLCLPNLPNLMLSNMYMAYVNLAQQNHLGYILSSEQYKMNRLNMAVNSLRSFVVFKIHGPCLSDTNNKLDLAFCLKCDTWISQAMPWVSRPRTTWPSPEIISKIVSCGVLFVPIGCKGSINAHLEWRVSFSIAEKILIFSFSHTQLLCYAMLKVLMKEIVEKHEDLKDLLCSYFLKTLMFWIVEEMDPYLWRPDNMIPCFMACLQRLLYCVKYSILSHYFIPDNNLFLLRFNITNKEKLITLLKNLYEQRINCFASSETLKDYQGLSYEVTESVIFGNILFLQQLMPTVSIIRLDGSDDRFSRLLYEFLHHSRTCVSKGLFALQLSNAFMFVPQATEYQYRSGNKHHYLKYKHDLSHLMIGLNADAVSGLLMLASFFYVHEQYLFSLMVIKYALQKYTDEKIYAGLLNQPFNHIQKYVVNLMKKEKFYTLVKSLIMHHIRLDRNSSLVPQELQLDVTKYFIILHPLQLAHFIRFLCYYHLHKIPLCRQSLQQLKHSTNSELRTAKIYPCFLNAVIICGIAHQLLGDTSFAREAFQTADKFDRDNLTSAASRLSSLIK